MACYPKVLLLPLLLVVALASVQVYGNGAIALSDHELPSCDGCSVGFDITMDYGYGDC